jgi:hypothetical protein
MILEQPRLTLIFDLLPRRRGDAAGKGAFSFTTPVQEESEAEPLQNFFPERHYVPLLEVLAANLCL